MRILGHREKKIHTHTNTNKTKKTNQTKPNLTEDKSKEKQRNGMLLCMHAKDHMLLSPTKQRERDIYPFPIQSNRNLLSGPNNNKERKSTEKDN